MFIFNLQFLLLLISFPCMIVRKYTPSDCNEIINLFYNTVHIINAKDYSKDQLDVWATEQIDFEKWNESLQKHYSLVAIYNEIIVGFGDIDYLGYIDRLFAHHNYQRKGIATAICSKLECEVNVDIITICASITSKPFFEKRGYRVIKESQAVRGSVTLTNYLMGKNIN